MKRRVINSGSFNSDSKTVNKNYAPVMGNKNLQTVYGQSLNVNRKASKNSRKISNIPEAEDERSVSAIKSGLNFGNLSGQKLSSGKNLANVSGGGDNCTPNTNTKYWN
jgi:hypothetical protein